VKLLTTTNSLVQKKVLCHDTNKVKMVPLQQVIVTVSF